MARYIYVGPESGRGAIPGTAFDEGVIAPYHIADLKARGHLVDADASAADPVEAAPAPEERTQAAAPAPRPRVPRQPAGRAQRPAPPARRK